MISRSKWWIMVWQSVLGPQPAERSCMAISNRTTHPPLRNVPHVEKFPGYNAWILLLWKSFSQSGIGPYEWKYVSFPARNSSSQHPMGKKKKWKETSDQLLCRTWKGFCLRQKQPGIDRNHSRPASPSLSPRIWWHELLNWELLGGVQGEKDTELKTKKAKRMKRRKTCTLHTIASADAIGRSADVALTSGGGRDGRLESHDLTQVRLESQIWNLVQMRDSGLESIWLIQN